MHRAREASLFLVGLTLKEVSCKERHPLGHYSKILWNLFLFIFDSIIQLLTCPSSKPSRLFMSQILNFICCGRPDMHSPTSQISRNDGTTTSLQCFLLKSTCFVYFKLQVTWGISVKISLNYSSGIYRHWLSIDGSPEELPKSALFCSVST